MNIRIGAKEDLIFAKEMLYEAFFWDSKMERPNFNEFFQIPEINKLLSNWGRIGDKLIIAENEQENIGAVWYRLWTKENASYGFVDSDTPELGMGLKSIYRSKGIGRILLRELINTAKKDGFKALSLSVDPGNFARYCMNRKDLKNLENLERHGFIKWNCIQNKKGRQYD